MMICLNPISRLHNVITVKEDKLNPYGVPGHQLKDIIAPPTTYEQAFYNPEQWCRDKWRQAITLELHKMKALKVWSLTDLKNIPNGRKPIKKKWVFDIKQTGIFRARLVACEYSQVPGIDFLDYYGPVVNDTVSRIVIIIQLMWKLGSMIMDVETAFFHGDLKETIYMHTPKGVELPKNQCVVLNKALYGLVQAAQQFHLNKY
jgi:hypothetical protein